MGETVSRILIVEDETRIASFVEKGLRANGFATAVAPDGPAALTRLRSEDFDLVILDLGLPGRDGIDVLGELRERDQRTPVVILTARDEVADTVVGFEAGADDYVTKPFSFEELLARVRARLRGERTSEQSELEVGGCTLDLRTRLLNVGGKTIELSAREFALAETFFRHPGQVLSREQILSHVWGYDYDPASNIVDVYVGYLRKKLGSDRIVTVRGMGYRLETELRR
jgi:DNA-binding response OmpR family regulator